MFIAVDPENSKQYTYISKQIKRRLKRYIDQKSIPGPGIDELKPVQGLTYPFLVRGKQWPAESFGRSYIPGKTDQNGQAQEYKQVKA